MIKQISIRMVKNGYIVFDTPEVRHSDTTGEYVFETYEALCSHIKEHLYINREVAYEQE